MIVKSHCEKYYSQKYEIYFTGIAALVQKCLEVASNPHIIRQRPLAGESASGGLSSNSPPTLPALGHELEPNGAARDGGQTHGFCTM
jgi:hypothetical protein